MFYLPFPLFARQFQLFRRTNIAANTHALISDVIKYNIYAINNNRNNSLITLARIYNEQSYSLDIFSLKLLSDSMRSCLTALAQDILFIKCIFPCFSIIYQGTVHLLPGKNNVAAIYKIIKVVKSWAAIFYTFLITSFNVTCCFICSSLIMSNSDLLLFYQEII